MRTGTTSSRRVDPLLALVGVVIVIVAALTAPPVRDTVIETARWLDEMLANPAWVGYYTDVGDLDARGLPTHRAMFAAAGVPGMPLGTESSALAFNGPWSPDGERVVIHGGTKVYVGNRRGVVRVVANLPDLEVVRADWVGSGGWEILVVAKVRACEPSTDPAQPCYVTARIDARTGAVGRSPLRTEQGATAVPFSPDGAWVPVGVGTGSCGAQNASGLYEIATERVVDLVDATGRRLSAIGWLRDSRLVSGFCDGQGRMEVFVGPPAVPPTAPIAVLRRSLRGLLASIDRPRDRILVLQDEGMVYAIEPDGRMVQVVRLPTLTTTASGLLYLVSLSRDARYLSFSAIEGGSTQRAYRAGLIEVATGTITWVCEAGCRFLVLR